MNHSLSSFTQVINRVVIAPLAAFCLLAAPAALSHSLAEGLRMIEGDAVYLDQMVVKVKGDLDLDVKSEQLSIAGEPFALQLGQPHTAERLFQSLEATFAKERKARAEGVLPADTVDLSGYIAVRFLAPLTKEQAKVALRSVYSQPEVAFAHFESHLAPAVVGAERLPSLSERRALNYPEPIVALNSPTPDDEYEHEPTPDFQDRQNYLEPAPRGVGAEFGWQQEGGDGKGIYVVDIENAWVTDHEDFNPPFWERVPQTEKSNRSHGTAVWGIVSAKKDGKGVTGIAPAAEFGTSKYTMNADTFLQTAERLKKEKIGVMIIELHRKGPDNNKYAPWEYWQETFDAFKKITSEYGIHIIAAAGNGNSNLDGSAYNGAFDLKKRDSGAVMVGAAGPAGDRMHLQRLSFSNYGSRLDAFGYGLHVTTTGYGSLFGKRDPKRSYTKNFSGTSSATPIVVGAAVSILGMSLVKDKTIAVLNMRKALRATGTKQKGKASMERIGNLPSIPQLVEYFDSNGWQ